MAAWTFRGAGTVVVSTSGAALTPTVTHSIGDLLILHTAQRAGAETVGAMTGWTQLGYTNANGSLEVWGRIADGSALDGPTVDWSGTTNCDAWLEAYYGGNFTDLDEIAVAFNAFTVSSSSNLVVPSLTVPQADCLIIAASRKSKTGTSNNNTFTAPGSFTERQEYVYSGTGNAHCSASWQQTTATNVSQASWGISGTAEALASNGLIVALATGSLVKRVKLLAHASAASAASVEGVVLSAGRDTVIGEFSGQAFEADLEGGEAVLYIDTADIVPDGDSLTTTDTPIVFAYNSTQSTIGPGSATVIEE